jgi:hypothetical protein
MTDEHHGAPGLELLSTVRERGLCIYCLRTWVSSPPLSRMLACSSYISIIHHSSIGRGHSKRRSMMIAQTQNTALIVEAGRAAGTHIHSM